MPAKSSAPTLTRQQIQRKLKAGATPEELGARRLKHKSGSEINVYRLGPWVIKDTGGFRRARQRMVPLCRAYDMKVAPVYRAGDYVVQPFYKRKTLPDWLLRAFYGDLLGCTDLHEHNVGYDANGQLTAFDW